MNEAVSLLPNEAIQAKMRRTIVKVPTEWEQATVDHRWGWLKEVTEDDPDPLTPADFLRLREHIEALCFWEEAAAAIGISSSHWHFHPREFVRQFRGCGWLSLEEMAQLLPRRSEVEPPEKVTISWNTATARFKDGVVNRQGVRTNKPHRFAPSIY